MSETTTKTGTAGRADDPKEKVGLAGFFIDSVSCSAQATATIAGGFAGAVGDGIRAYGESLTNENVTRFAVNNGFVEGTLAGYAKFFDSMADTARRALQDVRDAPRFGTRSIFGNKID